MRFLVLIFVYGTEKCNEGSVRKIRWEHVLYYIQILVSYKPKLFVDFEWYWTICVDNRKKTHIHWWQRGKCHHRCLHLRTLFTTWHTSHMYENKPVKGNYVAVCGRSCHIMFVLNAWQQRNYNTVLFILQIKLLLKEWNTKHKIDWHLTTTAHNKEASLIQSVIIVHNSGQGHLPPTTV